MRLKMAEAALRRPRELFPHMVDETGRNLCVETERVNQQVSRRYSMGTCDSVISACRFART